MKEYNIGLDIGVASVGWCVTAENGDLLKNGNRNLWGTRLFNEANTAAQTRAFRSSRRRNERRIISKIKSRKVNIFKEAKIIKQSIKGGEYHGI